MRILAYHAIADLRDDPVLAEYGVSPELFAAQLDDLAAHGWEFVDLDRVLAWLAGKRDLPRRAALVSFDDAYTDLLEVAAPLLTERGIPAVVFAVAGHLGGSNDWDHHKGAANLRLLAPGELPAVAASGIEVGSHTLSHRPLPEVPVAELAAETAGAADRIEAAGVPRPRAFSYPYGRNGPEAVAAVREAGYAIAFTTAWGDPRPGGDPFTVPRVEVHASDTPRKLRLKLALAAWPGLLRDSLLTLAGVRLDPSAKSS
ncbi:MAG TPA: polysaccharide deacetylase family protein [Solirubrobacterales bacterium]|nr:polysaccharide deacetylase family protein [Solirubrobacterales bacterium]